MSMEFIFQLKVCLAANSLRNSGLDNWLCRSSRSVTCQMSLFSHKQSTLSSTLINHLSILFVISSPRHFCTIWSWYYVFHKRKLCVTQCYSLLITLTSVSIILSGSPCSELLIGSPCGTCEREFHMPYALLDYPFSDCGPLFFFFFFFFNSWVTW